MPEQIFDYLMITLCIFGLVMFAISFFNQENQKAEVQIKIPNILEFKIKTTKKDNE